MASRHGNRCTGWAQQIVGLAPFRSDLTSIEDLQRPGLCIPVEKKATARQSGALGFHHSKHRLGADQGIDGIAACFQCVQSGGAGVWIGGDHDRTAIGGGDPFAAEISGFRIIAADRSCHCRNAAPDAQRQQNASEQVKHGGASVESYQDEMYPQAHLRDTSQS